jgi:hypothetical protein
LCHVAQGSGSVAILQRLYELYPDKLAQHSEYSISMCRRKHQFEATQWWYDVVGSTLPLDIPWLHPIYGHTDIHVLVNWPLETMKWALARDVKWENVWDKTLLSCADMAARVDAETFR